MNYSAYRSTMIVAWIVVTLVFGLVGILISVGFGLTLVVALVVLGAVCLPLNLYLIEARLDDYGGRIPVPNLGLGMWGVDIVDDRAPRDVRGKPTHRQHVVCPRCGSLQSVRTGKFCHECGAPLEPSPTPSLSTG